MQVWQIILFVVIALFVCWFIYDTVKVTIQKVKDKKAKKNESVDSQVDTTNDK